VSIITRLFLSFHLPPLLSSISASALAVFLSGDFNAGYLDPLAASFLALQLCLFSVILQLQGVVFVSRIIRFPLFNLKNHNICLLFTISGNQDHLSSELNEWTKQMLIEFILKKTIPSSVKLSDDLLSMLEGASIGTDVSSSVDPTSVALILKSVVDELKTISSSNLKLHDKLNKLNANSSAGNKSASQVSVVKTDPVSTASSVLKSIPANLDHPSVSRKFTVGTNSKVSAKSPNCTCD